MNKWGEIVRINYNKRLYILSTFKVINSHDKNEIYCPAFCLEISKKSAKKSREKNLSKEDLKFSLIKSKDNPLLLVREIIKYVKIYIEKWNPKFIYLGFYGSSYEQQKREKLYTSILNTLGYKIFKLEGNFRRYDNTHIFYIKN